MELSPEARVNAMHRRFQSLVGYLREALAADEHDGFYLRLHYFRFLVSSSRFRAEVTAAGLSFTQEGAEAVALLEAGLPPGQKSDDVLTSWMDGKTDADIRSQAEAILSSLSQYLEGVLLLAKEDRTLLDDAEGVSVRPTKSHRTPPFAKAPNSAVADETKGAGFFALPLAIVSAVILVAVFRHKRLSTKASQEK